MVERRRNGFRIPGQNYVEMLLHVGCVNPISSKQDLGSSNTIYLMLSRSHAPVSSGRFLFVIAYATYHLHILHSCKLCFVISYWKVSKGLIC